MTATDCNILSLNKESRTWTCTTLGCFGSSEYPAQCLSGAFFGAKLYEKGLDLILIEDLKKDS